MDGPKATVQVTNEGIDVTLYNEQGMPCDSETIAWADAIDGAKAWSVFSDVVQDDVREQRITLEDETKPYQTIDESEYKSLTPDG